MPALRSVVAIIPARLGSTRFPRKVLADATGTPMVIHVAQQAAQAACVTRVVLATDADEVAHAAHARGVEAVLTSAAHPNGTSRLAEAAAVLRLPDDAMVLNVQGDEPEVDPALLDAAADAAHAAHIGTVASPILAPAEADRRLNPSPYPTARHANPGPDAHHDPHADPNVVKAVLGVPDAHGIARAIYFSRAPVPFDRDGLGVQRYRHVGLYAYRVGTLREYAALPPTPLEDAEKLEQLRALEHGWTIAAAICGATHAGIDTPAQYAAFVQRWRATHQG